MLSRILLPSILLACCSTLSGCEPAIDGFEAGDLADELGDCSLALGCGSRDIEVLFTNPFCDECSRSEKSVLLENSMVYQNLCRCLEDPNSRLEDIVAVVERDPSVVARLLHIVNSAFFAAPRPLHSASDTVRYLGTSLLRSSPEL